MKAIPLLKNPLGDLNAEHDSQMLAEAFCRTPDVRALLEAQHRNIVVGRRGSGKSALLHYINTLFSEPGRCCSELVIPEAPDFRGLRFLEDSVGGGYERIKAGTRLAFRYGIVNEVSRLVSNHYLFHPKDPIIACRSALTVWNSTGHSLFARIRNCLKKIDMTSLPPDERIATINEFTQKHSIESSIQSILGSEPTVFYYLIDNLDEGFEPDDTGIAIVAGIAQAAVDISHHIPHLRVIVTLRDNIFRALESNDHDFTKHFESRYVRLHWTESDLFELACKRLRVTFQLQQEKNERIWNTVTEQTLHGREGFKHCLRDTLYRPRDVISLLNNAFYSAGKGERRLISLEDLNSAALGLSRYRLSDLVKEYSSVFPPLARTIQAFRGTKPELTRQEIQELLLSVLNDAGLEDKEKSHFSIVDTPTLLAQDLFSIGFLGSFDQATQKFAFFHDGRRPQESEALPERYLIHPCFWSALNLDGSSLSAGDSNEIFDEYEISVVTESRSARFHAIGQHISSLEKIELGANGAKQFEEWCLKTVRYLFTPSLANIELHPNNNDLQRRDIVGTNYGKSPVWKRILDDGHARQVIFEVKNVEREIAAEEYRQVLSYLHTDYGDYGFIITRNPKIELSKDKELLWVKEMSSGHQKLIVKLTSGFLIRLLSKIRSPQKHDESDEAMGKLLDTYTRNYLGTHLVAAGKKRRR